MQGVASHRGGVLVFISNLRPRLERSSAIEREITTAEAFDDVRKTLDGVTPKVHGAVGFAGAIGNPDAFGAAGGSFGFVVIPYWLPALVAATFVALHVYVRRELTRWRSEGRCESCGYDLRASGERCPECGKPTAAEAEGAIVIGNVGTAGRSNAAHGA